MTDITLHTDAPMIHLVAEDSSGRREGALDIVDGKITYDGNMSLEEFRAVFSGAWAPYADKGPIVVRAEGGKDD